MDLKRLELYRKTAARLAFAACLATACASCELLLGVLYGNLSYPTDLAATHSTRSDGILLSWTGQKAAASHIVYRSSVPLWDDANYLEIARTADSSWLDATIPADTNFWYRVTALDRNGIESEPSAAAYGARAGTGGAAAIPYDLVVSMGEYGRIRFTWQVDSSSAERVAVYRSLDADGSDPVFVANASGGDWFWTADELWPDYPYGDSLAGIPFTFFLRGISKADPSVLSAPSDMAVGWSFGGRASVPASLTASQGSHADRVVLSWEAVDCASGYTIRRSEAPGSPPNRVFTARIPALGFEDAEILSGIHYHYTISAFADTSEGTIHSDASAEVVGWATVVPGLAPPAGLQTVLVGSLSVELSWTAAAGAAGYRVYRAENAVGPWTLLGAAPGTGFLDYGLASGNSYWYRVSSTSAAGEGEACVPIGVTTDAASTLASPAGASAVPGPSPLESLSISWSASAEATGYRLWRATSEAGPYGLLAATTATTWEDAGLEHDRAYWYRLSAFNALDESALCAPFSGLTHPPVPAAPSSFSANQGAVARITLAWSPVDHAASYRIYRAVDAPASVSLVASLPEESGTWMYWDDLACLSGRSYFYAVAAVNSLGQEGPATPPFEGWLLPMGYDRPEPRFQASTDSTVTFGWSAASQAAVTGYELWRAEVTVSGGTQWTVGGYEHLTGVIDATAFTHAFDPADKGRIYSYKAAAVSDSGALGPRSNYPITVMNGTDLVLVPDAVTTGLVYPPSPLSYSFSMPANTEFFIYLAHWNALRAYNAVLSVKDGSGAFFQDCYHPAVTLYRVPATDSFYTVDAYRIKSTEDEDVTIVVEFAAPAAPVYEMINFNLEATASVEGHLRPW